MGDLKKSIEFSAEYIENEYAHVLLHKACLPVRKIFLEALQAQRSNSDYV